MPRSRGACVAGLVPKANYHFGEAMASAETATSSRFVWDVDVAGLNPVTQTIDFIRVVAPLSAYGSSFNAVKSREISAVLGCQRTK
jgi:hypothetical protein